MAIDPNKSGGVVRIPDEFFIPFGEERVAIRLYGEADHELARTWIMVMPVAMPRGSFLYVAAEEFLWVYRAKARVVVMGLRVDPPEGLQWLGVVDGIDMFHHQPIVLKESGETLEIHLGRHACVILADRTEEGRHGDRSE